MTTEFFQATEVLTFQTDPRRFLMITKDVAEWLDQCGAHLGVLTMLLKHTSASLTIQENADPTVRDDLINALDALAPEERPYKHNMEGPDDMPGHIKTMLTDTSLSIPVVEGRMDLGTWQGLYLIEHRAQQHSRSIRLLFQGTGRAVAG